MLRMSDGEKRRTLVVVPIIHDEADMGSLGQKLRAAHAGDWMEHRRRVSEFWEEIRRALANLALDYQRVRVYQDGLPCGGEAARRLVNEVAEKGSLNYGIVEEMLARGATIEQTEDPELLKEEYSLLKQEANAGTPEQRQELADAHRERQAELLTLRDQFIRQRIAATLQPVEVGVLFIGALHDVARKLPDDVQVQLLFLAQPVERV